MWQNPLLRLANCDCFAEVAESIDQLDDNEWDSKDNLPADFVVANNPPMERENQEDIFYAVADNTFSAIVTGEKAIDVPDGADISQLGLTEVLDAPDVSFPPIHFSKLHNKGLTAVFSDVGCSIRGSGGQGIGEALWNVNGLVMKEYEPGKANAEAETPTKVRGWKLDGQLRVLNFKKDNCDKKNSSAYHLEGEKLRGLGEKNADEPVIYEFPSDNPSPFPLNNAPAQTSTPYVTEIPHDPTNEPIRAVETPIHGLKSIQMPSAVWKDALSLLTMQKAQKSHRTWNWRCLVPLRAWVQLQQMLTISRM